MNAEVVFMMLHSVDVKALSNLNNHLAFLLFSAPVFSLAFINLSGEVWGKP